MPEKHKTADSANEAQGLRPSGNHEERLEHRFSSSESPAEAIPFSLPRDSIQRFPHLTKFVREQREQREQRQPELRDMPSTADAKRGVRVGELQLSTYLLARAIDGRLVEDEDLQSLRKANDTVNETRRTLKHGRGNVRPDTLNTKSESSWRAIVGQNIGMELFSRAMSVTRLLSGWYKVKGYLYASAAAGSAFTGAGNCDEHGLVAAHIHAANLNDGEKVRLISSKQVAHVWAESRVDTDHERSIVMDAWAKGPAVFSQDSAYSKDSRKVSISYTWDKRTGPDANAAMNRQKQELDRSGLENFQSRLDELKRADYQPRWDTWDSEPVIDASFVQRVVAKMTAPINPDRLKSSSVSDENMPAAFNGTAQAQGTDVEEQLPQQDSKIGLRNEILAAGVARSLGANVKSATKHAATMISSVKDMASTVHYPS